MNVSEVQEELTLEKVSSGDRPSIYALGLATAQALKISSKAVVMLDALGRVCLMPEDSIQVLRGPKLTDEDLQQFQEEDAISLLVKQGSTDEEIMHYLARRNGKG